MTIPAPAPAPARKPLLAHPEDFHCVVFHVVLMLSYALAMFLYLYDGGRLVGGPGGPRAAFTLAAALMLGWCSGINVGVNFHNHTHRRVFNSAALNRWFGRTWTVSGGWPSFYWQHEHVTVHHSNLLQDSDWSVPRRKPDGTFENIYVYSVVTWPFRYAVHLWKDFTGGRGGPGIGRRALSELGIFLAMWSIPFVIDPVMALGLWLLPAWLANAAVMGPGMYAQHAGCVPKTAADPYRHSNTYVSRFFNLTMFNIGYHVEHHDHPNVHWSALPALHERLKPELIDKGAHVLPFGYYRAGQLLCRGVFLEKPRQIFAAQHEDYVKRAPPAVPAPAVEPIVPVGDRASA
jgi:fatty acid desaturase